MSFCVPPLPPALLKSPGWSAYMGGAPPEVKTETQGDSMESSDCSNAQTMSNGTAVSTDGHAIMPPDHQPRAFVFPQPTPLSPGLLSAGIFNQNNNVPITPTLLTPVTSFSDNLFKGSSLYSPLTLAPPSSITQCLPKTPTLPPPSPHATAFPIMGSNYFTAGIFNPGYKGFDDLSKLGGLSPLLMSPAAAFPSSHMTQFFPSNMPTAESVASDGTAHMTKAKLMSPPTQSSSQHSNPSGPPSIASSMHEEEERKEVRSVCAGDCISVCVCVCGWVGG